MHRRRSTAHPAAREPRAAHQVHAESPGKLPEPTVCPDCGASYRNGRWTWAAATADASEHVCPACERIRTRYPAGELVAAGSGIVRVREDALGLVRHLEERERTRHPLKRIMAIADAGDGFEVTVTDGKLAPSLGRALKKAYGGRLEQSATTREKENLVRIRWILD